MVRGPDAALAELELAGEHGETAGYVWFHAARAYLRAQAGQRTSAREDYSRALALTFSEPARRLISSRMHALREA